MIITKTELESILHDLAETGNTYLCEAQLQFELAIKLHEYFEKQGRNCNIFLEYPVNAGTHTNLINSEENNGKNSGKTCYYDIVIKENDEYCPIELKYKTADKGSISCYGEHFTLKNQAAQNLGRYDYLKDVSRIENFSAMSGKNMERGYAVMLTNDRLYWDMAGIGTNYEDFALNCGRIVPCKKLLSWKKATASSVGKSRTALILNNSYTLKWEQYDSQFKYLMLEIS